MEEILHDMSPEVWRKGKQGRAKTSVLRGQIQFLGLYSKLNIVSIKGKGRTRDSASTNSLP